MEDALPASPIHVGPAPNPALEQLEKVARRITGLDHGSSGTTEAEVGERRLASVAEELYRRYESQDWRRRGEILRNNALYEGDHYKLWNSKTRRLEDARREYPWQVRLAINIIQPIVRTYLSRLTKNEAVWHVISGTLDEEDINAAKAATSIVRTEWERLGMVRKMMLNLLWVIVAGTGYIKIWWNPKARLMGREPRLVTDPAGQPTYRMGAPGIDTGVEQFPGGGYLELDEDGLPVPEYETDPNTGEVIYDDLWEGQIECEVVSPLDVLIDPTAQTWDDVEWFMILKEMPTTRIYSRWGKDVGHEESFTYSGSVRDRTTNRHRENRSERVDSAIVKELHLRPGTFPTDDDKQPLTVHSPWVIMSANDHFLEQGGSPLEGCQAEFGWSCLIPFHDLLSAGSPQGRSMLSDLRSVQVAVNRLASQTLENNALTGNRQWIATADCLTPETSFTNKPGDVIKVRAPSHGIMPKPIEGTGASPALYRFFEVLSTFLELISGQREGGLQGGVPAGVTAGIALEAIAERDESRFSTTVRMMELGIEQWGNKALHLVRNGWTEERMVSVVGEAMREEVISFAGQQITERMRLRVVPDSAQPRSKALRNQRSMDLFQVGGFGDLRDPLQLRRAVRELRKRLGEGVGDEADDLILKNIQNADRENRELLESGQISTQPFVHRFEEADIHMEIHTAALLSERYRENPQAQMMLVMHMSQAHEPFLMGLLGPAPGEMGGEGPPDGGEVAA